MNVPLLDTPLVILSGREGSWLAIYSPSLTVYRPPQPLPCTWGSSTWAEDWLRPEMDAYDAL